MSDLSIARRYAAALFDVTHKSGLHERAGQELTAFAELAGGHAELRKTLESPAIPVPVKKQIVAAILGATGNVSGEVTRLLEMLADRDRLALVASLATAFNDRLLAAKRIVPAQVVSAVPLTADARSALATALGRATGSQVTITERVDASLVGGLVARVGSTIYDGSVTRQLERLRQQLLEQHAAR